MKKKKPSELKKVRNYRATDEQEKLIYDLYMEEITLYAKVNKITAHKAKKVIQYSPWKVGKLLKKSIKVLL